MVQDICYNHSCERLLYDCVCYDIEIKIKDLKAELNKGEDSQIPMSDEEDD